jgi:hypothetical protein
MLFITRKQWRRFRVKDKKETKRVPPAAAAAAANGDGESKAEQPSLSPESKSGSDKAGADDDDDHVDASQREYDFTEPLDDSSELFMMNAISIRIILNCLSTLLTRLRSSLLDDAKRVEQISALVEEGVWRMRIVEQMGPQVSASMHLLVTPLEGLAIWYANAGRLEEFEGFLRDAPGLVGPNRDSLRREHKVNTPSSSYGFAECLGLVLTVDIYNK